MFSVCCLLLWLLCQRPVMGGVCLALTAGFAYPDFMTWVGWCGALFQQAELAAQSHQRMWGHWVAAAKCGLSGCRAFCPDPGMPVFMRSVSCNWLRPKKKNIRHLGILLSSAGAAQQHVDQLFQERLRTITWRIRHWSRYDLTVLGRSEVAKQILASCLAYHIQFVAPSAQLLQLLHRRILAFVLGKGLVPVEQLPQLRGSPSAAVASLPKAMGGIAQVDIRAHAAALQAKVAARLLWPHKQPSCDPSHVTGSAQKKKNKNISSLGRCTCATPFNVGVQE